MAFNVLSSGSLKMGFCRCVVAHIMRTWMQKNFMHCGI